MGALVYQSFADFTTADHEPKEFVLEPWLPKRGIGMVYGWRGVGKTFLVQWIAYAIATGASVLDWEVSKPRRVLHVDAEMDPIDLVDRYKAIQATAMREGNGNPELAAENLIAYLDDQRVAAKGHRAGEDGADADHRREVEDVRSEHDAEAHLLLTSGESDEGRRDLGRVGGRRCQQPHDRFGEAQPGPDVVELLGKEARRCKRQRARGEKERDRECQSHKLRSTP